MTNEHDEPAKNSSVLQDASGRWQPAPAYDLPSSQPYGDTTLALSVGGRRDGNISGARFVALGETLGIRERAARRVVDRIASSVELWVDGVDGLPFDAGIRNKLNRVIASRQRMLRE
jgi:serine/threonine-protein kinase HipA